jgi:crossover junction endodeoxyribonuclease RuvC
MSASKPLLLAFDLGTKCGWAMGRAHDDLSSGALNLAATRFSGGGIRFVRFRKELATMLHADVDQVVFEEVRRHAGVDAAHVYGGLLAILTSECEERNIPYEGIPVGTWKRHATGKGNASKAEIVRALQAKGFTPKTEDEADAIGIWLTGADL